MVTMSPVLAGPAPPRTDRNDWRHGRAACAYVDATDMARVCDEEPAWFLRARCRDPACPRIHIRRYCPRHFAATVACLAHVLCADSPDLDIVRFLREGEIPPRFRILGWGRVCDEGEDGGRSGCGAHPGPLPAS